MSRYETPWGHADTTPPFTPGPAAADEPTNRTSKGPIRVAAEAFFLGVAAAVVAGSILGWLLYTIIASDCYGDGWCELGAALYGLGLGALVAYVAYVVVGVVAIRRHYREGDRLVPSLIHAGLPVGLVILNQLAASIWASMA